MRKRIVWIALVIIMILSACSSNGDGDMAEESADSSVEMSDSEMASEPGSSPSENTVIEPKEGASNTNQSGELIGEKVIKTVSLEYETLDFQQTTDTVEDLVDQFDAYIEFSNETTDEPGSISGQQYKSVSYTLRVPTESLTDFLNALEDMEAYKKNEAIGTQDVTQTYRDTEARIEVLRNKEARLTALLEEAGSIEDIIELENSLSETIQERESLQAELETFDSLIDYTEVQLYVMERPSLSDSSGDHLPFIDRVSEAFMESMYGFFYFLQSLLIWIIYAIPFLIVIGLIGGILYYVHKKRKK
ncbi:DUF4349 domain-containing protein [Marinilactibacillus piezotolerans]|uniref:DUF4349 domain-containing protein n=1 Tax=Marinilactibacillus piezotolerans TaxID=258723 RepID=UPI0009AF7DE3|nr:DUF4349 domain-containing protein [Marinilactibacillus piezotolerans]